MYNNPFVNWTPGSDGPIKGDGIGGLSTRAANKTVQPDEPANYKLDLSFGSSSAPGVPTPGAGSNGTIFSNTGSKLIKPIQGVSQVLLSQIQWQSVSGVTSGDGYCRFRLRINDTEIFTDQSVSNNFGSTPSGFVLLLESATGALTLNPPLPVYTFKDGKGEFGDKQIIELAIQDSKGQVRTYTQVAMVLIATTKYYQ